LSEEFEVAANKTLERIKKYGVDIVIMKSKSPSCGYENIYDGTFTGNLIKGNGRTVDCLLEKWNKNNKLLKVKFLIWRTSGKDFRGI
jgi:Uncharacterized conserved protein